MVNRALVVNSYRKEYILSCGQPDSEGEIIPIESAIMAFTTKDEAIGAAKAMVYLANIDYACVFESARMDIPTDDIDVPESYVKLVFECWPENEEISESGIYN